MTDDIDREFQDIARVLEEDRPVADEAFRAQLDERVARRFGQERRPRRFPSRSFVLAGASAVLALVVVVGALAGLNSSTENDPVSQATRPAPAIVEDAGPDTVQSLSSGPKEPPLPESRASAGAERRVERSALLTLAAPSDRLGEVADRIVEVTDRHRGVVLDSSVSTGDDSSRGGSFSLRVPVAELNETMRDLSRLGEVRTRSEFTQDVTRQYDTLADRLTAARVERRGLLRRLGHTSSTDEADRLRARLDRVAVEIRGLSSELDHLRGRTDYTRISVTLVEKRAAEGAIGGADDALRGSLDALVGAVAIVLRVLAAVLPFAVLGALAWYAAAITRRRRREAILS